MKKHNSINSAPAIIKEPDQVRRLRQILILSVTTVLLFMEVIIVAALYFYLTSGAVSY